MIIVDHWQASGVAWVPWRIRECLKGLPVHVRLYGQGGRRLESYGLPNDVVECMAPATMDGDIVQIHHARVASVALPEIIKGRRPDLCPLRSLVTVHGEPDRSERNLGVAGQLATAVHVVDPKLLRLSPPERGFFLPNHPATPAPCFPERRGQKRLVIPFSHVARFKDHGLLEESARLLEQRGWRVDRMTHLPNGALRVALAEADACWVQMQGYVDLLTMECWEVGNLPLTLDPGEAARAAWQAATGAELPALPTTSRPEVLAAWADAGVRSPLATAGPQFMRAWTRERCGELWARVYRALVERAEIPGCLRPRMVEASCM